MKILKNLAIGLMILGAVFATLYFIKTNSKPLVEYNSQSPKTQNIENSNMSKHLKQRYCKESNDE